MKSKKVSVFGGTGFIGSNFLKKYSKDCILVPREERNPPTDNILFFISTTHNYHIHDNIQKDVDTNLKILLEVLENCKERPVTFNFISSWFVYGNCNLPANEGMNCKPTGFYSITKLCAEQLLESFCKTYNKDYRIIRLSNVYGSGDMSSSKKKNALQFLVEKISKNESVDLYHGGNFIRDYLHVSDTCEAINLVMSKGLKNEIYNVGSGKPHVFKDLMYMAINILDSKSQVKNVNPPEFHKVVQVKDMYLNTDKLSNLGFKTKIPIEQGIKEICTALKKN